MSRSAGRRERPQRTFPHEAASARAARHWAHDELLAWGLDDLVDDALLVLSELVANAVLHGRGPIVVALERLTGGVRIEVCDEGDGAVSVVRGPLDRVSGRGLMIVDHVTDRWGVDPAGDGLSVWAELTVRAAT